jgi:ATP-dependent Lon protease
VGRPCQLASSIRAIELRSDQAIESDPTPTRSDLGYRFGSKEAGAGLYRIEVSHQPGSGVCILNQPAPPPFREATAIKLNQQS